MSSQEHGAHDKDNASRQLRSAGVCGGTEPSPLCHTGLQELQLTGASVAFVWTKIRGVGKIWVCGQNVVKM